MDEIFNLGETILLDGEPLSLVMRAGVEAWIEKGIEHCYRYDKVCDPHDGRMKYRCLYEKNRAVMPFVLVNDPDGEKCGLAILFDERLSLLSRGYEIGQPDTVSMLTRKKLASDNLPD